MIKPSELRLGNWYNFKNPMSNALTPSRFDSWTEAIDFEAYGQPIPLSPEILEKAGFVNLLGDNDKPSREWSLNGFTVFMGINFVHLQRFDQWIYNYAWTGKKSPDCHYLHQLQNLYFALTGEELEIIL